ncbi:MAG: right-handed parallel beta-helix repeat-containing protein [Acidobacteria bacterium]|nr:right-handed parallel beta-helix repeat-containing protein [Acidobacteriota bacterium]
MVAIIQADPAYASKWYAANDGVDGPSCGTKAAPCRSITAAKANAVASDTIQVGPGTYGDLDGSGTVGDSPGEEKETPAVYGCMIDIKIPLTIVSQYGAGATVLDAGGTILSPVCIMTSGASGAVLGKPGQGFTLRNGTFGLFVVGGPTGVSGVSVEGNIAENSDSVGFNIQEAPGAVVKSNKATNNGTDGFFIYSYSGTGIALTGNLAQNNGREGFLIDSIGAAVTDNVAVNNKHFGFAVGTGLPAGFSKNTALGNGYGGLRFAVSSGPATVTIDKSNIFGNGGAPLPWAGANCGLTLYNGDAAHTFTVLASGSFWGSSSGPGPDPADRTGGDCNEADTGPIALTTDPFAINPIPISPQTIQ